MLDKYVSAKPAVQAVCFFMLQIDVSLGSFFYFSLVTSLCLCSSLVLAQKRHGLT